VIASRCGGRAVVADSAQRREVGAAPEMLAASTEQVSAEAADAAAPRLYRSRRRAGRFAPDAGVWSDRGGGVLSEHLIAAGAVIRVGLCETPARVG
jgi:hypothetical protein